MEFFQYLREVIWTFPEKKREDDIWQEKQMLCKYNMFLLDWSEVI